MYKYSRSLMQSSLTSMMSCCRLSNRLLCSIFETTLNHFQRSRAAIVVGHLIQRQPTAAFNTVCSKLTFTFLFLLYSTDELIVLILSFFNQTVHPHVEIKFFGNPGKYVSFKLKLETATESPTWEFFENQIWLLCVFLTLKIKAKEKQYNAS